MSTQPRKQRRRLHNLPQHKRREQISAHLAEDLLLKYNRRSTTVRAGDTVKILRGDHKGTKGKVIDVLTRQRKITVEGATITKADHTEMARPIDPSNVIITKLDLSDPRRSERLGLSEREAQRAAAEAEAEAQEEEAEEESEESA